MKLLELLMKISQLYIASLIASVKFETLLCKFQILLNIISSLLGHDKIIFVFSDHILKSSCAMRFICLKNIHAGAFFRNKISIRT